MNNRRMVVLAGGVSSRMRSAGPGDNRLDPSLLKQAGSVPKGMLPVGPGGRPFLDYLLFNARAAGASDIIIVVGGQAERLRAAYGRKDRNNSFRGLTISYAVQPIPAGRTKPLGTSDALLRALRSAPDWQGTDFVVCNSDNLYSVNALKALYECLDANALIDYDRAGLEFDEERITQFSLTRKDRHGYITEIAEKPDAGQLEEFRGEDGCLRVSMNIFRLQYDLVVPYLERCPVDPLRHEQILSNALNVMVRERPKTLRAIPWREHVPDLTTRGDIEVVRRYLAQQYGELSW